MLYEPLTLRSGVVVPNRIALAPLTNLQSLPDGTAGPDEIEFLGRRADGGFGLVSTCAAYVARDGQAWDGQLAIDRAERVAGLSRIAARIRRTGAAAIVQLFHGGVRAVSRLTGEQVWSASSWREDGERFEVPRAATAGDLSRVIDQFAAAASYAERAGFDGVELHAAHGYLLSQFLSRTMNPRDDGWGGDLAGRARLVREVARACRARVTSRFAIGVRLSFEDHGYARGQDLDDNLAVARWLAEDGVDFVHASLWDGAAMSKQRPGAHVVTLARAALPPSVAVLAAGSIWTPADAHALIERGADVVAIGRAAILDPDWPRRAAPQLARPGADAPAAILPPLTRAALHDRAVSPVFAGYLTRWKDFVAD
ncbi:MAG: NADH:flavin oxidoreductase [Kofleriaceae bacterium]